MREAGHGISVHKCVYTFSRWRETPLLKVAILCLDRRLGLSFLLAIIYSQASASVCLVDRPGYTSSHPPITESQLDLRCISTNSQIERTLQGPPSCAQARSSQQRDRQTERERERDREEDVSPHCGTLLASPMDSSRDMKRRR